MYTGNYGQYPYTVQRQEVVRVNGRNGAEAYQMAPNSSALLLDESAPVVWLKVTDGASYPTINGYVITPLKEKNPTDALTELETRIARLESMVTETPKLPFMSMLVKMVKTHRQYWTWLRSLCKNS